MVLFPQGRPVQPRLASRINRSGTKFVARQDWQLRELNHDAVLAEVPGRWSDYQLAVTWQRFDETMQVTCRIDVTLMRNSLASWRCLRPCSIRMCI